MLSQIVAARREDITQRGQAVLERFFSSTLLPEIRDFTALLAPADQVSLIAEVKKASPSKGTFLTDFDPVELASLYEKNGAQAVSVITEERFFAGSPRYIEEIKNVVQLPVLRKDFLIDERQLYESRLLGADAVLLITALLPDQLLKFVELALHLGMEPVVEIHDRDELLQALDTPARVIGINNRNLTDFTVDFRVCLDLISLIPSHIYSIAESGIRSQSDMLALEKSGFQAALAGEALVTAPDIGARVRELVQYRGGAND